MRGLLRSLSRASSSSSLSRAASTWKPLYPRRSDLAEVTESDVAFFRSVLEQPEQIIVEQDDIKKYNVDWLKSCRGRSSLVLRPRSTQELQKVMQHCNANKLAVVPQGGNTGLVGGSVPVHDEIVVSMELMNSIASVDPTSSVAVCDAGVVLASLDASLAQFDLCVPLDLGARGSCHIGGNVATNAGGIRLLRYGSLHANVLGLEVVLADGTVLDTLSTLRKDNTGYDLKQIFIGSEGTLGIITRIALLCAAKPKAVNVAIFAVNSFEDVKKTFIKARSELGEILSAFELLDEASMECVVQNAGLKCVIGDNHPFYVVIETSGSNASHDTEKLNGLLSWLTSSGSVLDGAVASSASQARSIFELRERVTEACLKDGYCYKYDISLPMDAYYQSVEVMRDRLSSLLSSGSVTRVLGFGHVGDGNVHLNITGPAFDANVLHAIEPFLYEWIREHKGSISAEHGLGAKKRDQIWYSRSASAVAAMRSIKSVFDPKGILNPYKVIPAE